MNAFATAARQAAVVERTEHRPWPLPSGSWLQAQTWERLLFLHWRFDPHELRPLVPSQLELQTFDGAAWLGITPFRLTGLRIRGVPPLPRISDFLEANARTYVTFGGKPGVWFFTLDTNSRLTVAAARRLYRLPYHLAPATFRATAGTYEFRSRRAGAELGVSYRPAAGSEATTPSPGSLEHFLVERYCLYSLRGSQPLRAEIHHPPWALTAANVELETTAIAPIETRGEPLAHLGARQDVVIWPPEDA